MKYKSSEDGSKAEELIVPVVGGEGSLIATIKVLAKDYLFQFAHQHKYFVDFTVALFFIVNKYFIQDLIPGPVYKINITACVEDINKVVIESKPLHEKITVTDEGKLSIFREEADKERRPSLLNNGLFLARHMSTEGPELSP